MKVAVRGPAFDMIEIVEWARARPLPDSPFAQVFSCIVAVMRARNVVDFSGRLMGSDSAMESLVSACRLPFGSGWEYEWRGATD